MGEATRHPTAAEMAQMGALIDSAMRDGAVGLGTGLIYLPSTFFSTEELIALTKYVVPYRGGYAAHIRSEGTGLLDAIRETVRIAAEAGTWAEIRHIKSRSARADGRRHTNHRFRAGCGNRHHCRPVSVHRKRNRARGNAQHVGSGRRIGFDGRASPGSSGARASQERARRRFSRRDSNGGAHDGERRSARIR